MQNNFNNVSTFLTNKTSSLINHANLLQNKNHLLLKSILQLIHKNKLLLQKAKTIKNLNYSLNQLLSLSPSSNEAIIQYILTHYIQVLSNAEGIALSHKECTYKIKQLIYEHVLTFPNHPHYEICNEIQLFYSANKRIQHCASCSAIKRLSHARTTTDKKEGSSSHNRMLKCKSKQLFGYADACNGKNTTRNESIGVSSRTLNVEKESSTERKNVLFKTTAGRRGRTRKNNCVLCNSNTLFSNSNANNNNISHLDPIPIIASEYDYVTPKSTYDDTMNLLSTIRKYA